MKQINGYSRYFIDTIGNIYDIKKKRYICQWVDNTGYKQCNLYSENGIKVYKRIHRLVAETYIPNAKNLPQVNHKDGNKLNNNVNNLEWTTNSENTIHGYRNNLYHSKKRSHSVNVYDKNWNFLKQYKSIRKLSEDLNLNRKTVTAILKNQKKNNYNYKFEYIEESPTTIENIA